MSNYVKYLVFQDEELVKVLCDLGILVLSVNLR